MPLNPQGSFVPDFQPTTAATANKLSMPRKTNMGLREKHKVEEEEGCGDYVETGGRRSRVVERPDLDGEAGGGREITI